MAGNLERRSWRPQAWVPPALALSACMGSYPLAWAVLARAADPYGVYTPHQNHVTAPVPLDSLPLAAGVIVALLGALACLQLARIRPEPRLSPAWLILAPVLLLVSYFLSCALVLLMLLAGLLPLEEYP